MLRAYFFRLKLYTNNDSNNIAIGISHILWKDLSIEINKKTFYVIDREEKLNSL